MNDPVKQEDMACGGDPSFEECKLASNVELEITLRYLYKLKEESNDEAKKEAVVNYDAIVKEIANFEKQCKYKVREAMLYTMSFRISSRLSDYIFDEPLTDEYCLKLKEIFNMEEKIFQKVFLEVLEKDDVRERKKIIDNVNLIKSYLREKEKSMGITLSEQKLQNAALRIGGFICDLISLTIVPSKNFPIEPDDDNPPS
ncbi:gamete antigen 27/25, putative [Plasmodium relictum]|uniref:Gamete antigen 27/25, putative n=1 Tax=Plasmodium relictum TaxID=85471 RepID=A0A1J1GPK1_PLARL|nr:gamete antigen 27/25, putative [Plasmodium relictum]CRG85756.1 gamete antigen 27/25, putative [Plasmodium relictum]